MNNVIFNIPNTISWFRIILTAVIVLMMYLQLYLLAFILFLIASVSDYFDGFIARKTKQVTNLGKVLDQMSDKILITSVLIIFVELRIVPGWLVVILVFRDTLVSVVRMLATGSGKVIAANVFGKFKTVSQIILTVGLFMQITDIFYISEFMVTLNKIMVYVVAIVTIISGVIYLYQNREHLNT
ncbi:MAG: CDP-diacylglycerol--glycerol-3-phosphate 3-phosphatidyltransferase [Fervidobacterium sp.]